MNQFCEITPELRRLAAKSAECSKIDPELYTRYDVKRGLRDLNGKGVLVGLTEISEVSSTKIVCSRRRRALLSWLQCQRSDCRTSRGQPLRL